jgi:hypothetical protein
VIERILRVDIKDEADAQIKAKAGTSKLATPKLNSRYGGN